MSFASPFPEVDIPSTSAYEFLFGDIDDADADRVALIDAKSGRETTYRAFIAPPVAVALAKRSSTSTTCPRSTPSCAAPLRWTQISARPSPTG
jgi:hypothetical protein